MTDETIPAGDAQETTAQDVADFIAGDSKPTPDDAREMFAENPGLAWVLTTEGGMHRNGLIDPA